MNQTVEMLADLVGGIIRGDGQRVINDAAAIESANRSAVTFVIDATQIDRLENTRAGAIVIDKTTAADVKESPDYSLIIVTEAQSAFQKILPLFRKLHGRPERSVSPRAVISSTAQLGSNCYVGPEVVIGDDVVIGSNCEIYPGVVIGPGCRIGDDTSLHPNVVLYHDVILGNRVIIHSGAVIGADGFGYRFVGGRFEKISQLGTVHIHDDVEIGACTTVDRGAIGPTIIGTGTKLDNLVMIAHNCEVGRHNVFASQVGMAGSTRSGDYVRLGGQVGIRDHVRLENGCTVGAKAGVHKNVPAGTTWLGVPATPEAEQKRMLMSMKCLPEMRDQIRTLEKQIAAMSAELAQLKEAFTSSGGSMNRRAAG